MVRRLKWIPLESGRSTGFAGLRPQLSPWFNVHWSRPPSLDDLQAILLLTRDHFETINGPAWSLVHELRISLIFPVIVALARRLRWPAASVTAALVMALGLTVRSEADSLLNTGLHTLTFSGLFLAGAALATHRVALADVWNQRLRRGGWLVLVTAVVLYESRSMISIGAGAVLLLIVALHHRPVQRVLESAIPQWLGRVSYSLYLSHMVVLVLLVHSVGVATQPWIAVLLAPVVALVVAEVLRRYLELPSQRLGRSLAGKLEHQLQPTGTLTGPVLQAQTPLSKTA
jgi:peptidoglycan/LPS O-acetylase OafA/YrhL